MFYYSLELDNRFSPLFFYFPLTFYESNLFCYRNPRLRRRDRRVHRLVHLSSSCQWLKPIHLSLQCHRLSTWHHRHILKQLTLERPKVFHPITCRRRDTLIPIERVRLTIFSHRIKHTYAMISYSRYGCSSACRVDISHTSSGSGTFGSRVFTEYGTCPPSVSRLYHSPPT